MSQHIADDTVIDTTPMLLAFATGGRSDTTLIVKEYTWPMLCNLAKKPRIGEKDGSYLIRGGKLSKEKRADEHLLEGELIVLDGDSQFNPDTGEIVEGAPPLPDVAKALDTLGITFCSHTSHSSKPEQGFWKYRILIPAKLKNQSELVDCVDFVLDQLRGFGIYLTDVPEAKRWSQPWYLPRVRDEASLEHFVSLRSDCLPFDVRMAVEWADGRRQAVAAVEAEKAPVERTQPSGDNKIRAFNDAQSREDVRATLERAGYRFSYYDKSHDVLRFMRPNSTTKTAGVVLFKGSQGHWCAYSHHGHADPLSGKVSDPFGLIAELEHRGDKKAAYRALFPLQKEPSIAERIAERRQQGPVLQEPVLLDPELQALAASPQPDDEDTTSPPEMFFSTSPLPEKPKRKLELIPSWELKDVAVRWLIKDIMPAESFMALYGRPGSYKSFVALYLSCCIAMGSEAFGKDAVQGSVVYIAGEGGAGLKRRWDALRLHYEIEDDAPVYFIKAQLNLRSTLEDAEAVIVAIRELGVVPSLIVVDTFARAFAGGEENSAKDVGEAVSVLGYLQEQMRCGVLIVHHAGKDESRGMRGSSALLGAVDLELECKKISSETSSERVGQLTITKQKDGEDGVLLGYKMIVVPLSNIDPDATSLAVEPVDNDTVAKIALKKEIKETHNEVGVRVLEQAIREAGKVIEGKGDGIPAGVKCVTESIWKQYFRSVRSNLDGKALEIGWGRVKEHTRENKISGNCGEYYWLLSAVPQPSPE